MIKQRSIAGREVDTAVRSLRLPVRHSDSIIAVGASTGGTTAIEVLLAGMPKESPGMVIVQHMPEYFTKTFAERLNTIVPMEVREAQDNDLVEDGLALIAPGDFHMMLSRAGKKYRVHIKKGPPVHHQRPSVDVLFTSVARFAGEHTTAVLLTGMGADGARGMKAIRECGGHTIAQDESSCVVFGMPREAIRMDAAEEIVNLYSISDRILRRLDRELAGK